MIVDLLVRIDQRRDYYHYFHSGKTKMIMSQEKNAALLAYWLIKYKPLYQNKKAMQDYFRKNRYTINESFALSVLKYTLMSIHKDKKSFIRDFFSPKNNNVILYNLMHRDMSKEAFILYVTSLIGALEI